MSKIVLGVVAIILILLGVGGLVTSWDLIVVPAWLAWVEIGIGVISAVIVAMDSKE